MPTTALNAAHYAFNPLAAVTLATAFLSLALGAAVVIRERGSRVSFAFSRLCTAVWIWLFGFSLLYLSSDPGTARLWAKASYLGVPFIPPAMYHFTARVLDIYERRRRLVWSAWAAFAVLALVFTASDWFFGTLYRYSWGFYPRFEPGSVIFVVPFVGLILFSLWEFWRTYRDEEPGTKRLRGRAFLAAFGVADVALIDFLPAFGVHVLPIGFLAVLAFLTIAAAAVWRYRLADLTPSFIADRLVRTMPDMLIVADAAGRVTMVNPAFRAAMRYEAEQTAGRPLEELADSAPSRETLRDLLRRSSAFDRELALRARGGEAVEVSASSSELRDEQGFRVGTVLVARDIRERKRMESELVRNALFDRLTGLPNRALLLERIERAQAHSRRRAVSFAVLYLDLDGFEIVNDTLGHSAGDEVLAHVARRLMAGVREADTVARLEGDQFGILVRHVPEAGSAVRTAERLQETLSPSFIVRGQQVSLTAAVGIALSTTGYDRPGEMLRDAHAALGRAKQRGRGQVEVFDREMRALAVRRLSLESELRRALEAGELRLRYQPIVDLEDGRPCGYEALLRWHHPERGWIGPGEFLQVAEETGLIVPIGAWALRQACRELQIWREAFIELADLRVHVNISTRELARPELADRVESALLAAGLPPEHLVLEITETTLMEHAEAARRTIGLLRAVGVRLAIDDFGTGYSSLAYLHAFPVQILKIDRSFIGGAGGRGDVEIIRAIVALGDSLGMDVIAEGVETEEQLRLLRSLGCRHGQGYRFSFPLDPPEIARALHERVDGGASSADEDWTGLEAGDAVAES